MGGLLARDTPPIWDAQVWARARSGPALAPRTRWPPTGGRTSSGTSLTRRMRTPLHVAVVVALAVLLVAWRAARPSVGRDGRRRLARHCRVRVPLLLDDRHRPAHRRLAVLAAPAHRAHPVRGARARRRDPADAAVGEIRGWCPELYMLWILFAVDTSAAMLAGVLPIEQVILALEMLAGIAVLAHALSRRGSPAPPAGGRRIQSG